MTETQTTTPTTTAATPSPAPPPAAQGEGGAKAPGGGGWRDTLPDDLKGDASLGKYKDVAELARAYKHAEAYQGRSIALPGTDAKDEDYVKLFDKLGRPKDPTGYGALSFPEGVSLANDEVVQLATAAHKHGLTVKQFQGFVNEFLGWRGGQLKGLREAAARQMADAETALKSEWGASFAANAEIATRAMRALGLGPEEIASAVRHPASLRRFHAVAQRLGEDKAVGRGDGAIGLSKDAAQEKIDKIRRDPTHPYHHGGHPDHKRAVAEMNGLYETIYGKDAA